MEYARTVLIALRIWAGTRDPVSLRQIGCQFANLRTWVQGLIEGLSSSLSILGLGLESFVAVRFKCKCTVLTQMNAV